MLSEALGPGPALLVFALGMLPVAVATTLSRGMQVLRGGAPAGVGDLLAGRRRQDAPAIGTATPAPSSALIRAASPCGCARRRADRSGPRGAAGRADAELTRLLRAPGDPVVCDEQLVVEHVSR